MTIISSSFYFICFVTACMTCFLIPIHSFRIQRPQFPRTYTVHHAEKIEDLILKKIDKWACVKNCGACCKLGPMDSRPDLKDVSYIKLYLRPHIPFSSIIIMLYVVFISKGS